MPYLSVSAGWQAGDGVVHSGQQCPQGQADVLGDRTACVRQHRSHAQHCASPPGVIVHSSLPF